eukprot:7618446-Pyramimonas_sp.AAC.1
MVKYCCARPRRSSIALQVCADRLAQTAGGGWGSLSLSWSTNPAFVLGGIPYLSGCPAGRFDSCASRSKVRM